MNSKNEKTQGCGCESDMLNEVEGLVKEGTKPTKAQHDRKQEELDSIFNEKKK